MAVLSERGKQPFTHEGNAMKRKGTSTTEPMKDTENIVGKAYSQSLKERAMLLRSSLLLSGELRLKIARDLDALSQIAESHPEVFSKLG